MTGIVAAYIQHFTYLGLLLVLILCGLGLPMPEDVALLAGGYLVHRGLTSYPVTLAVSLIGVVTGDNSLYFIGRRFGTGVISYLEIGRPNAQPQIDRLKAFMDRHGHMAIFYARFLAGVRALVYLIAGSVGVKPRRFFFYDFMGAIISVPIVVSLGYVFGAQIEMVISYLGGFERLIWIVLACSVLVYASRILFFSRVFSRDRHIDHTNPT